MSAKLLGSKELERTFRTLGERVQRKVLRAAVSAGATPVVKAAKAKAPRRSGLTKKALGKKVVTSKDKQSVTAVVGAKKNVQGEYKGKPHRPARILHLIEKPHIGPDGSYVAARPFLNPAFDQSKGQALDVLKDKLAAGVEREAAKGAK